MRFLPRQPLDWTRGAGRPAGERPQSVTVIVPVYGAAEDLERCLASVVAETDLARHALTLVIDGPQDAAVERVVGAYIAHATILRNDTRRGFVGSVNRGMAAASGDVVLLNSDTIVTPRWLEKLIDACVSSGDIGTVTPLSNHATLCSVPRSFEENLIPSGHDVASFAALVERVSARERPRLPTGVGVCFYIRRALLDDIGLFDEERFGLGYGEENDFCIRALAKGWLHVADDATFISHAGHRSFGASRAALQRTAGRTLARRHPRYMATIAKFMKEDPLRQVRQRILHAISHRGSPRPPAHVTHLVHGWPPFQHAGTELYAYWLVQQQLQWREVSVFTRMADPGRKQGEAVELNDHGARVRLVTNNFVQRDPFARNAMRDAIFERSFERFLREEKPELLHIHHLAGHAFSLARVARRLGIPIVQQIQDWWSLCGRVNLFDFQWQRCSGPALGKCARCAPLTAIAPAPLWNRALHLARRTAAHSALAAADAYVMGSQFIHDDYARAGLLAKGREVFVLPYGVQISHREQPCRDEGRPLQFGFIGSILPHKGLHVAVEAFRGVDPSAAVLKAWGNAAASPAYTRRLLEAGVKAFTLEGTFAESEKAAIFASIDVLLVPSIGLESFGLAAREAMVHGVPVIATADGALLEMFEPGTCGDLFPSGDANALAAIIRRLAASSEIVDQWRARIPQPKSVDEHAEEIEEVYRRVLARRS